MYVDVNTILLGASLLTALGSITGAIITVYKAYETNKKQSEAINAIREEQTLVCYGMRGALQGIVELGGNGPVKDALAKLEAYLNKTSHKAEF
ncbi:MAG: branched-chain amino acid ABC transporter permease [Oscillibacter sp.]|nr:branched-chain amino acid ABC transporter permease [Oscillibacter sp.]